MARSPFEPTKSIENQYISQLRNVSKIISGIVSTYTVGGQIRDDEAMTRALEAYSTALTPWAEDLTARIITSINNHNEKAWNKLSKNMSEGLKQQLQRSPVGLVAQQIQREQVAYITSLPEWAGLKAQEIAQRSLVDGVRADVAAKDIARVGEMTQSRAILIARTETSKANTALSTARALSIGAEQYVWRTAEDSDVRESHREMANRVFSYNDPPYVEGEGNHGPGDIYNCRCWPEPIIPASFYQ